MARLGAEHLGDMSDEGRRVRERRERLGVDKKSLAEQAGVNRNTLAAIENGESFNRSSLAKIERVLTDLEHEAGIDAPPAQAAQGGDVFEFEVTDPYGIRIVAKGPVRDAEELKRQVLDIIRDMRGEKGSPDS